MSDESSQSGKNTQSSSFACFAQRKSLPRRKDVQYTPCMRGGAAGI